MTQNWHSLVFWSIWMFHILRVKLLYKCTFVIRLPESVCQNLCKARIGEKAEVQPAHYASGTRYVHTIDILNKRWNGTWMWALPQACSTKIAEKTGEKYDHIITWLRCKLSFLVLRACLLCVRGSRPHHTRNETEIVADFTLACDAARLDN